MNYSYAFLPCLIALVTRSSSVFISLQQKDRCSISYYWITHSLHVQKHLRMLSCTQKCHGLLYLSALPVLLPLFIYIPDNFNAIKVRNNNSCFYPKKLEHFHC